LSHVRLVHWNAKEAEAKAAILRAAGCDVAYEPLNLKALRELRYNPPTAVIIDLTRLPTQGRDVAVAIRHSKTTRHVPIVFVDGDPEKVALIKTQLPDAVYTTWNPKVTVVPRSLLEGYSGAPLVKKLGIKANAIVALVDAPDNFEKTLASCPKVSRCSRKSVVGLI
jgi:CheY-like chemotaxis protein